MSGRYGTTSTQGFMFSTCRLVQTGLILLVLGACSREAPQSAQQPLVMAPPDSAAPAAGAAQEQTIASELVAAGVPTSYRATFATDRLQRIAETRASSHAGEYEFHGARLTRYAGAALADGGAIELRFDLKGAVTMSSAGSGPVPAEEISAIRTRAQLLRSHALAQRATQSHQ
jgi:hypothetical protein